MNEKTKELLLKYANDADFSHYSPTDGEIADAERALGVRLPGQYAEFLREFGDCNFNGMDLLGFGKLGVPLFVKATLRQRDNGLPGNLVVVKDVDEWQYCLDCDTGKVVSCWVDGEVTPEFDDFDAFFLDEVENAVDNL
jgi:hypothetical protein